jgi:hypothetical protein
VSAAPPSRTFTHDQDREDMMNDDDAHRRCAGTTRDGAPCTAWATATGYCAGHSGFGIGRDPRAAGAKGAESRRRNRDRRQLHAERRNMTLKEALRERAAEERDALVDALFAPLVEPGTDVMTRHRAAVTILERMIGRPREALAVEEPLPELTIEQLIEIWSHPHGETG